MHHGGGVEGVLVHVLPHEVAEVNQELSALRDAVIRPGCEVELTHRTSFCSLHLESDALCVKQVSFLHITILIEPLNMVVVDRLYA